MAQKSSPIAPAANTQMPPLTPQAPASNFVHAGIAIAANASTSSIKVNHYTTHAAIRAFFGIVNPGAPTQ
jgi:hypothetical protein